MHRKLAVLTTCVLLFACKPSATPRPPAMSPEVALSESAMVGGGGTQPDQPMEADDHEIAVGFDGTSYLVVWTQPGGATLDDIWGARMTPGGGLLGAPFPISTAPGDQQTPALAFDGQGWLVVFQDHRVGQYLNVYGARVAADGTVLDPAGLPIATQVDHQARPAVAFDGTTFLVVWGDRRAGMWDVYGARVGRDGAVQDLDGIAISAATLHQGAPAVAFDGASYLVVWEDQRSGQNDLYAARVTPGGAVLDPAGIPVSTAKGDQRHPAVAFDGHDFVVAWQDLRSGVAADVYAARVSGEGNVLDAAGIPVAIAAGAQTTPALAFDGVYTLVAWAEESAVPASVHAARIGTAGMLLDPAPFVVASGTAGESLAVASDGAGRALVAYDALDAATGAVRVRARALTDWATLDVQKAGHGGGTVTSSPAGIDCGGTCSARFDAPTDVSLAAAPDGDSVFGGWSGACAGDAACAVTVDAAKSVTARFLALYPVTVAFGDDVPGTVTSDPAGIQCGTACSSRYPEGTRVRLTARGVPGVSVFSRWEGDCGLRVQIVDPVLDAQCGPVMDGPKNLTVTFVPAFTVTINAMGTGAGAVALAGTTCAVGSTCRADVAAGTTATLTASPAAGSVLKSWSGCTPVAGAPNTCTVLVSGARNVTARFEPSTIPLTASTTGAGVGTVTGAGLSCTSGSTAGCTTGVENPANTNAYTTVTLTATPRAGSVFKAWSGCTPVQGAPSACTIVVSMARTVTARFEPSTFPLTAVTSGTGSGTVTGGGLACATGSTAGCTVAVENPADSGAYTSVTLTATASGSSVFKSWVGCTPVAGSPNVCTIVVSAARTVTAKFEPSTFPLTAVTTGTGSGTVTGAGLACATGSSAGCTAAVDNPANTNVYATVTLTATPGDGSVFKSWLGCQPVANAPNTCTVLVSAARSVTAKFEPSTLPLTAVTTGTGTGTVTGGGLACTTGSKEGCTAAVENPANSASYTTVTLVATSAEGSVFKSWMGCSPVAGAPSTCTVLVSAARTVTAKFEPSAIPLTAVTAGTGAGTVTGGGLDCTTGSPEGCTAAVPNPANTNGYTSVTLTAAPSAGSVFKTWTGCAPVQGTPDACVVLVSAARTVTAKFEPSTIPLTASTMGTGSGTVTGAGLACTTGSPDGCTAAVENPANTGSYGTVTLGATPAAGSVFKGWSGCSPVAGTPDVCTVLVSAARTVTAKFEPSTIPLTASTIGTGSGTVTGGGLACTTGSPDGCTAAVENPANTGGYTTVTLTAAAAPGSVFKSWIGCSAVAGTPNECTVLVNAARTVTARFEPSTFAITLMTTGTGTGTVTGPGLACTSGSLDGCTATVENPANTSGYTTVTLTAAADAGSTFRSWSGCQAVAGAPASCTLFVNGAKTVAAGFVSP